MTSSEAVSLFGCKAEGKLFHLGGRHKLIKLHLAHNAQIKFQLEPIHFTKVGQTTEHITSNIHATASKYWRASLFCHALLLPVLRFSKNHSSHEPLLTRLPDVHRIPSMWVGPFRICDGLQGLIYLLGLG